MDVGFWLCGRCILVVWTLDFGCLGGFWILVVWTLNFGCVDDGLLLFGRRILVVCTLDFGYMDVALWLCVDVGFLAVWAIDLGWVDVGF